MAELMDPDTIVVVASVDESYVMPLAVTMRSVLENLRPEVAVKLFVLEDATQPESRGRAEESWDDFPISVEWITPDKQKIEGRLQDRGHAGVPATYFRLLVGELLPAGITKAIYLDADIVVTGDLGRLWELELNGHLALAVPDAYFQLYHRARLGDFAFHDDDHPSTFDCYFNAGVLVIDVEAWRKEAVGPRALTVADHHKEALTFHDQDALNYVLRGRWGALGPTWNLHELFDGLMYWDRRQYRRDEVAEALHNPRIIHFIGPTKPWMRGCGNLHSPEFVAYLSRTSWAEESSPKIRLLDRLVSQHGRLNWLFWRGVVHEQDRKRIASLLRLLVTRPWMLLTYPLWQAATWIYFTLGRVGRRVQRKKSSKSRGHAQTRSLRARRC